MKHWADPFFGLSPLRYVDITGPGEEVGPLESRHRKRPSAPAPTGDKPAYCSDCGTKLEPTYEFCPNCGKDV